MVRATLIAAAAGAALFGVGSFAEDAPDAANPPKDAVVLFDGKDAAAWRMEDGKPFAWKIADGAMEVVPKGGGIETKESYRDFRLHVEFWIPKYPPEVTGQKRGNSGVYLQHRYEIQVLDSFGLTPEKGDCGAVYGIKPPDKNACKPPEEWQTYDITFRAARFDADGKKTENARVTVVQNGVTIHDNVEIPDKTGHGRAEGPEPGPLHLQDHGCPVRFRNIWIVPADTKNNGPTPPALAARLEAAKVAAAKQELAALGTACDLFELDLGRYPTTEEGINALIAPPASLNDSSKWKGPYIQAKHPPLDPWGNPYRYSFRNPGAAVELYSTGPDGQPGTADDIAR